MGHPGVVGHSLRCIEGECSLNYRTVGLLSLIEWIFRRALRCRVLGAGHSLNPRCHTTCGIPSSLLDTQIQQASARHSEEKKSLPLKHEAVPAGVCLWADPRRLQAVLQ